MESIFWSLSKLYFPMCIWALNLLVLHNLKYESCWTWKLSRVGAIEVVLLEGEGLYVLKKKL